VVQRQMLDTKFKAISNDEVIGMYRHDFKLHRSPLQGNWSIVASYGPRIGNDIAVGHHFGMRRVNVWEWGREICVQMRTEGSK
jgi:hypothetical protein